MIADSRYRVHIPLPAVRPRQRSWGTSLPQSVVLILRFCMYVSTRNVALVYGPLVERTVPPGRNGLPLVLRVMSNHVGTRGTHVRRFPRLLTHSRLPAVAGRQSSRCSPEFWFGDRVPLPSSALSTAISLPDLPPFSPLVPGGSSCRGPGDRGLGVWDANYTRQLDDTEKHLWLDSL